jgi:hypothetical protein
MSWTLREASLSSLKKAMLRVGAFALGTVALARSGIGKDRWR